jgi:photosystem II stability/assembly factor-like uncharacterized protein
VIDPRTPSRIFGRANGLFLSTDSGATWNRLGFNPLTTPVIDPQNPSTIYAVAFVGRQRGVYKSTDGGIHWAPASSGLNEAVGSLAIDPKTPSTLYAVGGSSVYKSTDSAGTWTPAGTAPPLFPTVAVDSLNPSVLYALNSGGIFRSTDSGATWTRVNNGLDNGILPADPTASGLIYAAGDGGVFRSADGGGGFTALRGGLPSGSTLNVLCLTLDPVNASTLYLGLDSGGLYKSTDRGTNWTLTPLTSPVVNAIAIDPSNPARIYAGTRLNVKDAFVAKIVE